MVLIRPLYGGVLKIHAAVSIVNIGFALVPALPLAVYLKSVIFVLDTTHAWQGIVKRRLVRPFQEASNPLTSLLPTRNARNKQFPYRLGVCALVILERDLPFGVDDGMNGVHRKQNRLVDRLGLLVL
jgi:hypothetical protein